MYFKGNLCLRQIDISYFPECLLFQININNEKGYITVLYRSPSQTSPEFNNFRRNLDKILSDFKQLGSTFFYYIGGLQCEVKNMVES